MLCDIKSSVTSQSWQGDAPMAAPDVTRPLRVSEVSDLVKQLLEAAWPQGVWVTGEVSNLARPASGHVYLKLKDAASTLAAVLYRAVSLRLRFDLRDGMEVEARGRLTVYVP